MNTHSSSTRNGLSSRRLGIYIILAILLVSLCVVFLFLRSIEVFSMQVTNITPTSATIVWTTTVPAVGGVVAKEGNERSSFGFIEAYTKALFQNKLAADTRDLVETAPGVYERKSYSFRYTHHVTINNLEPETEYIFRPFHTFGIGGSSKLFSFKTPTETNELSEPMPVYGSVELTSPSDIDDVILISYVVERNSAEINKMKSQRISSPMKNGTFVIDVGNLYEESMQEQFPKLLDNLGEYTLAVIVLTRNGQFPYEVSGTNFQPIDTIVIEDTDISSQNPLISQVFAKCDSHCVGDCQGCNDDTAGDPLCKTYGCGYMSYCCGTGSCEGHCSNGKQDCDETGTDCGGGGCATCGGGNPQPGGNCPGQCEVYDGGGCKPVNPASNTCECAVNGKEDGDESGIDCGGSYCPGCNNAGSHCFNGLKDQGEDGTDCGGDCAASCATSTVPKPVGQSCANEGEIFVCADRPDWNCWCSGGKITTYHRQGISVVTTTQPARVSREALLRFLTNSKFGIHTGWGPGADYDHLVAGGDIGYVMNVITGPEYLQALIAEYQKLPAGVVPIVRFCHAEQANSCPFTDPAVAEQFSESLAQAIGRPVAIISGPNEPLQEPWTVAANYPQCAGKTGNEQVACNTAQWMNEFVARTGDTKNLIRLSPDFNTSEDAFHEFVAQMKANGANFSALDGIAGNAYVMADGRTISDVIAELKAMGFNEVYITEAGVDPSLKSSDPENYRRLVDALNAVVDDPAVKSLLLFNPVAGLSQDANFDKHELTQEQFDAIAAALSGSGATQTLSPAPGYVVTPPQASPGSGGGYSCSSGTKSVQGNTTCCNGAFLSVCSDGSKTYIHNRDSATAGDVFVRWDGRNDVVGNIGPNGYWTESAKSACMHIHTRGDPSQPEHPGICINSGGASVGVSGGQGSAPVFNAIIKPVHAEEDVVNPGVYTVTGVNVEITTKSIDVVSPGVISYYYDTNENGQYDDGETFLTDDQAAALQVTFDKELDLFNYTVQNGWNSMSFPIAMTDDKTAFIKSASDLITYLNVVGLNTTHVAVYRDQQFVFYSERFDDTGQLKIYGDDFGILPGEAYFVKTYNSGEFSLAGYRVTSSIPVTLNSGWNFVGFYNKDQDNLQAFDLLRTMQTNSIPADILSRWENNRYEGVVLQNSKEYGYDFNVYPIGGYWVRVGADGSFTGATFTP